LWKKYGKTHQEFGMSQTEKIQIISGQQQQQQQQQRETTELRIDKSTGQSYEQHNGNFKYFPVQL